MAVRPIKHASGRDSEMADVDSAVAGLFLQKQVVESGDTVTIPSGYHATVGSGFTIEGDLILDGDMTVL